MGNPLSYILLSLLHEIFSDHTTKKKRLLDFEERYVILDRCQALTVTFVELEFDNFPVCS